MQIFHIRTRRRRSRSNQFYLDRSDRGGREALCGGEVTMYDVMWHEKAASWTREDGERVEPCAECLRRKKS